MSLLEDDLEEVINTSTTRTDGARPELETFAAVRAECTASKERLLKNLRYIIAHKERWSIMRHVRSRVSHLARLAFTRLLRRLCADGKRYVASTCEGMLCHAMMSANQASLLAQ